MDSARFENANKLWLDGHKEEEEAAREFHAMAEEAKFQLETALQIPGQSVSTQLRKQIYQQMSRMCHYLGETEEEQKYLKLMQSS
jgi:hypothetical protein